MRQETKITKYYQFNELSEAAKSKAVDSLYDVNIAHEWWEHTYEDAKTIGCKILEFDIDRGSCCEIRLDYEDSVIDLILKNHGKSCETYKIAESFKDSILDSAGNIDSDAALDFKKELQEAYLSILRREFEYLTSEEAILESIEANEYEFDENGKLI